MSFEIVVEQEDRKQGYNFIFKTITFFLYHNFDAKIEQYGVYFDSTGWLTTPHDFSKFKKNYLWRPSVKTFGGYEFQQTYGFRRWPQIYTRAENHSNEKSDFFKYFYSQNKAWLETLYPSCIYEARPLEPFCVRWLVFSPLWDAYACLLFVWIPFVSGYFCS